MSGDAKADAVEIVRIGARGDGVAIQDDGLIFVPFALPGERWRTGSDGVLSRLNDSAERRPPSCPHFGACGGCVAQHMSNTLYREWKSGIVGQALAQQGIEIELEPLWQAPEGSRRRVVLSAESNADGVSIGFRAAGSHRLVAINDCVVAAPAIVDTLPVLAELLRQLASDRPLDRDVRVHVLSADNGIDIFIGGINSKLGVDARARLAERAEQGGVLRLRVGTNEIFQAAVPVLTIAGYLLRVPAGTFLQAVAQAEAMMAVIAVKACGRARRVADLFCGLGAFTLPMARRSRVLAVDNEEAAISALDEAVRHATGLKPVECLRRDLFREPLSRGELNAFDAVVFDPPRAGAPAQAEALAKSTVPVIVAVSCNPATLARDLRTLIDGGYRLQDVTPVDQFIYSAHVEVVAVLKR